jgi:hypothetical protein
VNEWALLGIWAGTSGKESIVAHYASYMLRVWRSSRHDRAQWVAKLEDLHSGRGEQFTSRDALISHLCLVLEPEAGNGPDPPGSVENAGDQEW